MKIIYSVLIVFLILPANAILSVADEGSYKYGGRSSVSPGISNLNVRAFCQDSLGNMWIGTSRGLNRYNGYEYARYFHDPGDSLSLGCNFILSLLVDSSHRLWVGTQGAGLNSYDFASDSFRRYASPEGGQLNILSIFEDSRGTIWAATSKGIASVDTAAHRLEMLPEYAPAHVNTIREDSFGQLWAGQTGTNGLARRRGDLSWEYIELPDNRSVTCMAQTPNGMWWLGTDSGLMLFDRFTDTFRRLPPSLRGDPRLSGARINFIEPVGRSKIVIGTESDGIFLYDATDGAEGGSELREISSRGLEQLISCYVDRQGNVWIGSFDHGFTIWRPHLDYFNTEQRLSDCFRDKFVTRIVEDGGGNLWISTRYHGLWFYPPSGKAVVYDRGNCDLFGGGMLIESIFIDSRRRLWIGMTNNLVIADVSPEGALKVRARKNIERVGAIAEDLSGVVWTGSEAGLYMFDPDTLGERFVLGANITDIEVTETGGLLLSAFGEGIFSMDTPESAPTDFNSAYPAARHTICLFRDSKQRLWAGSYGYGAVCFSDGGEAAFTTEDGLPSNDVIGIEEDRNGDIWMSTSYGLAKLRPADRSFVCYYSYDGTFGDQYHEKAVLRESSGRLFFGGNHGLTFFNPIFVQPNSFPPPVHFENFTVMNLSEQERRNKPLPDKNIAYADRITLNHRHTVIAFDYAGIDFTAPQKLTYAYKMEGVDKDWNYVGGHRRATYSNLNSGEYVFMVKAVNNDGVESVHPAAVRLTVKPAPWFTWQAWLFYVLAAAALIYFLLRTWFRAQRNKQLLELEAIEREREREVTEMKISFFTNISHELRTPLTLISAPLEQLSERVGEDETNNRIVAHMSRNVKRLLMLVNQLLDFSKMEKGELALQVRRENAVGLTDQIVDFFSFQAEEKRIELATRSEIGREDTWIDRDKFDKTLNNLLSNALKHTPSGGSVTVSISETDGAAAQRKYPALAAGAAESYIEISVRDTGTGVPPDKMNELFVRYRRIDDVKRQRPDYGGSGIGLHYSRKLIESHRGAIGAFINPDAGMTFSFVLPAGDVYGAAEKTARGEWEFTADGHESGFTAGAGTTKREHGYTILVAEDNGELMAFIRDILSPEYDLLEAADGNEAWDMISRGEHPDLVLSDVLMPGMSGFDLCANIKRHNEFCHIPVVLLTAKATMKDQLEGLEHGANAYICKPFNVDFLLATIRNAMTNRDKLRTYYSTPHTGNGEQDAYAGMNSLDRKFMDKLINKLDEEMANPNLNVSSIGIDLGFSRAALYRKIKGLTDMSPLDFIRSYKLRRAAEMILEGKLSLSEIADRTGFGAYSYFSIVFKKHFGVSPYKYGNLNGIVPDDNESAKDGRQNPQRTGS